MDPRLIVDPPAPGPWNMAVDEALFQTVQRSRQMTLRFYQWSEPTLSLGYFQRAQDRQSHSASLNCPMVRRTTGGGAILHDCELTYSLVAPIANDRSDGAQRLVMLVHGALIEALSRIGVPSNWCRMAGDRTPRATISRQEEPFLCFQRRTAEDVELREYKIAGSAQRRLHSTLLQHGSVLVSRSSAAPELPGIGQILEQDIPIERLREAWTDRLGEYFQCSFQTANLSVEEGELACQFERSRFGTWEWNRRR
jgi:lipoate-protein ligase A